MDRDSELLVAYLQSRPSCAFIPWVSRQFDYGRLWSTYSVDVRTVDKDAPGRRWAWTIVGREDMEECDPEELWYFEWPHDVDVYEIWKAPAPPRIAPMFILELPLRRDEDTAPAEVPTQQGVLMRSGWTSEAISAALNNWAQLHAGRDDLHFFWDDIAQFSVEFDASDPCLRRSVTLGPGRDFVVAEDADGDLLRYLREAIEEGVDTKAILQRVMDEF